MHWKFLTCVITGLFFLTSSLHAAEILACENVQSAQDVLACALARHPEVQVSELNVKRDSLLIKAAKQRPNPELDGRWLTGEEGNDSMWSAEASLLHTVELGGKRKGRIQQALATETLSRSELLENQELSAVNTVLALYRLRQIRAELAALHESLATFSRTQSNYRNRPKLAPEQEVSATVFGLASDEYKLEKATLLQEQEELSKFLELATGLSMATIQQYLPAPKQNWPEFLESTEVTQNSALKRAEAEQKLAKANLKLAKSKAWPDFKLGPAIEKQAGLAEDSFAAGVQVSFALPILNLNRGEIGYAQQEKQRAELAKQLALGKAQNERARQLLRYQSARAALKNLKSNNHLQASHEKIEKYFTEGLISSPLVIESHRQLVSRTQLMNQQELTAIDALWQLYILDGKFLEGKI